MGKWVGCLKCLHCCLVYNCSKYPNAITIIPRKISPTSQALSAFPHQRFHPSQRLSELWLHHRALKVIATQPIQIAPLGASGTWTSRCSSTSQQQYSASTIWYWHTQFPELYVALLIMQVDEWNLGVCRTIELQDVSASRNLARICTWSLESCQLPKR